MTKTEFKIGKTFYTGGGTWICTDIGTRVIVAIRVGVLAKDESRTERAIAEGRLPPGPPYAVNELVFDEYDMDGCSMDPKEFV
mgnify:CR=1 FL=1